MPHFALKAEEAEAVAAYLLAPKNAPAPFKPDDQQPFPPSATFTPPPASKAAAKPKPSPRKGPDAKQGERLAWTLGCVACHTLDDAHQAQPFDGGDLRLIAAKRPSSFFARWLADPSSLNTDRRMPEFELTSVEREDLAAYLATLGSTPDALDAKPATNETPATPNDALIATGREIFLKQRCVACHRGPGLLAPQPSGRAGPLNAESRWDSSCLDGPDPAKNRPGYQLSPADQQAIRSFVSAVAQAPAPRGRRRDADSGTRLPGVSCARSAARTRCSSA
jgi:mono/diheme cytochrome c family protein